MRQRANVSSQGKLSSWADADTLSLLHKAKDLAPGYALPHYYLAKAYEQMTFTATDNQAAAAFLDLAARAYKTAIDLEPTYAWYHVGLGWVYVILSERDPSWLAHAKRKFEIASKLAPKDPHVQKYLKKVRYEQ